MRLFIALRYFVSHKRQSAVCIAGVAIAVTMFLTMSSMMDGFKDKFIIETVESSGHITIHEEPRETQTRILEQTWKNPNALLRLDNARPRDKVEKIKNATGVVAKLRHMPGVVAVAPVVVDQAIATYGTKTMTLTITGVDPEQHLKVTTIGKDVKLGDFSRLKTTGEGIVIGNGIALMLGATLDDTITLSSPTGGKTTAKIVGVFQTGVTPVDYSRAYMLINNAQTLLDRKNIINQIIVRTDDYTRAEQYAAQIESVVGYKTESWQEANANFLKIFRIQTVITYIINLALLIVAAFGVLNILIMAVLERVNDIAILKSFGLSRGDITQVYVFQGLMIGLLGSTMGVVCGKLAIEGLRKLPIEMEGLVKAEGLLMSETREAYLIAFVMSVLVTIAAAVYPARRAAGYDPVDVIRGAH